MNGSALRSRAALGSGRPAAWWGGPGFPWLAAAPGAVVGSATSTIGHSSRSLYTVGHSTRSQQELLAILAAAGVAAVADVRAFPSSRRHPHFNAQALAQWLPHAGIDYVHLPDLGGRRRPAPNSPNSGWREPAFQGYADHMMSEDFEAGLDALELLARERSTAIMCAEATWWRCHRRLIADALTVRRWRVEHLGLGARPALHELTPFAVVENDRITYPAPQGSLLGEG